MIYAKHSLFPRLKAGLSGLAIAISFASPSAAHDTLKQALEAAYENSAQLKAARANLLSLDEGVVQARAAQRLNVSGQAQFSRTRNDLALSLTNPRRYTDASSVTLTATQLITDFGRTELGVYSAQLEVLSGREALKDIEQSVLLNAVIAYMNTRRAADVVRLSESNVRVLREQLSASKDRFEVGEVTRTDVSQTEARLAQAIGDLENAKGQFEVAREGYRATIGSYPSGTHKPANLPAMPKSGAAAEKQALDNHPRMREAQFDQSAAEITLATARKNRNPSITGSLSLSTADPNQGDNNARSTVTLGVTNLAKRKKKSSFIEEQPRIDMGDGVVVPMDSVIMATKVTLKKQFV